jgi:hypothetical protein
MFTLVGASRGGAAPAGQQPDKNKSNASCSAGCPVLQMAAASCQAVQRWMVGSSCAMPETTGPSPRPSRLLQCTWNRRGCRWAALLACLFGLAWWIAAAVVATGALLQHAASGWALLSRQAAALLIGRQGVAGATKSVSQTPHCSPCLHACPPACLRLSPLQCMGRMPMMLVCPPTAPAPLCGPWLGRQWASGRKHLRLPPAVLLLLLLALIKRTYCDVTWGSTAPAPLLLLLPQACSAGCLRRLLPCKGSPLHTARLCCR